MTKEQNTKNQFQSTGNAEATSAVRAKQENSTFDPMTGLKRSEANGKTDSFNETGKSLMAQVKDTASQAYDTATEKASTKLEEQKSNLASGLTSVAGSVRQIGENLQGDETPQGIAKFTSEYSDTAAQKIEQAANYFENNDLNSMYRDVESFARKNPMVIVGGAFVLGVLAARFLKSSQPKSLTAAVGQSYGTAKSYENGEDRGKGQRESNPAGF